MRLLVCAQIQELATNRLSHMAKFRQCVNEKSIAFHRLIIMLALTAVLIQPIVVFDPKSATISLIALF